MFNKIKLGPKLIAGFLVVSLVAAILGVGGIYSIKKLNKADTYMYEKDTLPLAYLIPIAANFQETRVDLLKMVYMTESNNEVENYYKRIQDLKDQTSITIEKFNKTLSADEKPLVDKAIESEKKYLEGVTIAYNFLKENNRNKAIEIIKTDLAKNGNDLTDIIGQLTKINTDSAKETADNNTKLSNFVSAIATIIVILGVIISLFLGIFLARTISNTIKIITEAANRFAIGDIELKGLDSEKRAKIRTRGDELGSIAVAFHKLIEYQQEKVNIAGEIAKGNIDVNVIIASDDDKLGIAFKETVSSLNKMMNQINSAVEQTASGSNQVASASQSLSQGATEQASSLEEITSSITEINSQAKQNADNALQASGLAKKAFENSEQGNRQMKELVDSMNNISKNAEHIKKIVKIIDDIAFQTNLLALNANVEAARAGKYGKGFAVVAEEVRNLAGRSAVSVKETTAMVEEAVKNILNGNNLVEITAKQLDEIANSSSKVADLVEEIATASREQTLGLEQINQGLGQIDQVTQANTANAEESASAAEELAGQAEQLKAIVAQFKLSEEYSANRIEDYSQKKVAHINKFQELNLNKRNLCKNVN